MKVTAVVVRPSDRAVLMVQSGLPEVEQADGFWFPDVESVLRGLRDEHGIEAVVLTCLSEDPLTYLMLPSGEPPAGARWVHDHPVSSSALPSWTRPEWYGEAPQWIAERVKAAGPWTQVKSWGLSNVLRIPTADGDVYFKALSQASTEPDALPFLFANEPLFLQRAATDRPGAVPTPLAIDEERAWMLLPDLGTPLQDASDVAVWIDAVRNHARLQRSYVTEPERLLEYSCADRRLAVLDAELDRLLEPNSLTGQLDPEQQAQLPERAKQLREAITELAGIGVPETLLHGDLHPRNLAVRNGEVLAFDWTDAALAHPFLDLVTFMEESSPLSSDARVLDAYLSEWEEYAAISDLRRALTLAEELGSLHQTITYLHLVDHLTGPSKNSMSRGGSFWLKKLLTP
ncbi:aminoglycoside phosphotransferase family protein [Kribbella sindirgiensis]|uniref:Aminoglycoside phosphotransferase family protein n=1 Tax=Kribbella sindirgiensis TaxID=1124744 RepID=A0A4R0IZS9_9ACTN|nr:aminoglycoside phosphotransferase family protein [Kribbella sindirgiensis]TCC39641.1 aminoglycoside phosphotransferase family protein [Kribbella sindirgiensis]